MNKKLGMSNFQIGILFFLAIITCVNIGGVVFFIYNQTGGDGTFNIISSNPSNQVVGRWEVISENNNKDIYEFFPDGSASTGMFASTYSFPDQTHMRIDTGKISVIYEYTLSNDELTLASNHSLFNAGKPVTIKLKKITNEQ